MVEGLPSLDPRTAPLYPGTGFFGEFEHSYSDRGLRLGPLVQYERMGFPIPSADEARVEAWGIGPKSTDLDFRNQFSQPYSSSEIVRRLDIQRCIAVDPNAIVTTGVAFELAHWRVPASAVLVLEQIPTIFDDVTALDDQGIPLFAYGSINGERLCRSELVHTDPAVIEPLTWEFHLTYTDDPDNTSLGLANEMAYLGPVLPQEILGNAISPPWTDLRYGSNNRWAEMQQFLAPSSVIVRYWIVLRGPQDRFRVRVGTRLGGFWQLGGRRGAALDAVQVRRV